MLGGLAHSFVEANGCSQELVAPANAEFFPLATVRLKRCTCSSDGSLLDDGLRDVDDDCAEMNRSKDRDGGGEGDGEAQHSGKLIVLLVERDGA